MSRKTLLIVYHTMTGGTEQMARAAAALAKLASRSFGRESAHLDLFLQVRDLVVRPLHGLLGLRVDVPRPAARLPGSIGTLFQLVHRLPKLILSHLLLAARALRLLPHLAGLLVQLLHAVTKFGRRLTLLHGALGIVHARLDSVDPFLELFRLHLHVYSLNMRPPRDASLIEGAMRKPACGTVVGFAVGRVRLVSFAFRWRIPTTCCAGAPTPRAANMIGACSERYFSH